ITISMIFALFCFSLAIADIKDDFQQPSGKERIPADVSYNKENLIPVYKNLNRENTPMPEWEFIKYPTTIMTSYYDYMPGSYNVFPIRIQTDWGDGIYMAFFGRPNQTANRRQYWAYLDSDCNLNDWGTMSTYDRWQGYGGIAVHPTTGNCIAGWHEDADLDEILETTITYDDYDLIEIPGFWQFPTIIPRVGDTEFIWPRLEIGPSPLGELYLRVYHISNDASEVPEDCRIMYTDVENYNSMIFSGILDLANWSEVILFTDWCDKDIRPFQTFAIDYNNPGKVAFIGYNVWLSGDQGDMPVDEGMYAWESYDYGETWDYANLHTDGPGGYLYPVANIPNFTYVGEPIDTLYVDVEGWHYTALYDSEGNLHMPFMQYYAFTDSIGTPQYADPTLHYLPQGEVVWDGTNFIFHEVPEMPGIDPLSGHSVPWEIVGDDTLLYTSVGWSAYPSIIFHENTQKQAINMENDWMLQMWADATYHKMAIDEVPGYEDYLEHPIIFISVSSNNGETWSEPIELTDIYFPDYNFSEEITVYPYVCDQIIDLGDNWGQVIIYYFDDNSFGSYIQDVGEFNGGQINFCSIKIQFPIPSVDPDYTNTNNLSLTNYPNPFTTFTHISFSSMKSIQNPIIEIYNIKGQLVRTLEPSISSSPNEGYALWDGKDSNNNAVTNGIYFYKLITDNGSITNKMLLTR
ncbi:MAG: T9SS type A sorting domain-containing protein, partial [Candidatus Cloacimonetes bacterium]|nr:T9SS type A sorting domain-containing protein [Candidatus Cloacimonadota bacterium]